ncbi:MAG: AMP-dependent synthetase/ligase [Hydrotalea sp.]|nr:AMP-dependent synthetase/ligase [Hydrotalea sp.]
MEQINHSNVLSLFLARAEKYQNSPWLFAKSGNEDKSYWSGVTWREVSRRVNFLAQYLEQMNLGAEPKIAILSESRPEWIISLYAIWAMGGTPVPIMPGTAAATIDYILQNSEAKVAIISNKQLFQQADGPTIKRKVKHIIGFSGDLAQIAPTGSKFHYFSQIIHGTQRMHGGGQGDKVSLRERAMSILPNATSAILYTSGTSGRPRGVMLTHQAQLAIIDGVMPLFERLPKMKQGRESFLSFLPLSHCYEFNIVSVIAMALGARVYFAEGLDKLSQNMLEVKPTIMTAVPRLYDALRTRVLARVELQKGMTKKLLLKTIELGMKRALRKKMTWQEKIINFFLSLIVRRKLKKSFGGHLKAFISGGAPLSPEVGAFINALGVRVLQGYGLTEASIAATVNLPFDERMDSVGVPIKGLDIKIAPDGEILLKGPTLMNGYWRDPKATKEAFTADGYLKTGDIGKLDNGHLYITDRKKDIIVNSGGENIAPQKIENALQLEPAIRQAMVYGDKKSYLVALLVVAEDVWQQHGKKPDELKKILQAAVDRTNKKLAQFEKIRKFTVTPQEFTIANEMLSPTLKLRRHAVLEKYKKDIDGLYR